STRILATSPYILATSTRILATLPHILATSPCFLATSPCILATSPCILTTLPCFLATSPYILATSTRILATSPCFLATLPCFLATFPRILASPPQGEHYLLTLVLFQRSPEAFCGNWSKAGRWYLRNFVLPVASNGEFFRIRLTNHIFSRPNCNHTRHCSLFIVSPINRK